MKTKYIIALAAGALALVGCQREELAEPGVLSGKEGVVKFAPSVGGIVTGVKSSASEDASAATYTQPLTLTSEDGGFTLPMGLSVTSLETGNGTKATLINETGGISDADFATAIGNIFWVAAWDATPSRIIPDDPAGEALENYVEGSDENGWYQKVAYRNGASGKYWMTIQKQTATVSGAPADADDEYIWKKIVPENGHAETKTFFAYANLPGGATVTNTAATSQTLTLESLPNKDILLGYYSGEGYSGDPAKMTGTAGIHFYHPLTAVKFKKGTLSDGVSITGISINGVYTEGKTTQSAAAPSTFTWTDTDGNETVSLSSVTVDANGYIGEAIVLIPQTFSSSSKARIKVVLKDDADESKTLDLYYPLNTNLGTVSSPVYTSWIAGYTNTYTISFTNDGYSIDKLDEYIGNSL